MKRRDFIALSTVPVASAAMNSAAPPNEEGRKTADEPQDTDIIASATKLKLELFRGKKNLMCEFEISGSFGIDKEYGDDDSSEPDEALSLPLIHKLLAAFMDKQIAAN